MTAFDYAQSSVFNCSVINVPIRLANNLHCVYNHIPSTGESWYMNGDPCGRFRFNLESQETPACPKICSMDLQAFGCQPAFQRYCRSDNRFEDVLYPASQIMLKLHGGWSMKLNIDKPISIYTVFFIFRDLVATNSLAIETDFSAASESWRTSSDENSSRLTR